MKLIDLFEGGGALKSAGVGRISREDIPATIHYVSKLSGIPKSDLHALGSVGKAPSSGDMDFAIDISKYDPQETHSKMAKVTGPGKSTFNKGTQIGSYAIPIAGDAAKGFVQVDFMFVPKVEWSKFAYFSPGEQSKYKGVVRTILLRSIASSLDDEGTDMFAYDTKTNDLMIRVGRSMDMNLGLRRIIQLRPKKKRGEGFLKTMKTVTMDELESAYPGLNFSKLKNVATIDNPEDALKVMFGRPVKPSEVETAEQVVELIKKLPAGRRERIMQAAKNNLIEKAKMTSEQIQQLFGGDLR